MTNKHLAYLLATTLLAAPAFAQTSGGPGAAPGSAPGSAPRSTAPMSPEPGAPGARAPGASDAQTGGGSGTVTQERSTGGQPMGQSGGTTTAQPRSGDMKPGDPQTTTRETITTETSQPRTPGRAGSTAEMNKPLAGPGPNQMMASDVRGTRVYGSNNENVGDISDILINQNGEVVALVVGVGGFLGIGQKDVAIPFDAIDFVAEGQQATASRTSPPATTGTTGSGAAPNVSGTTSGGATTDRATSDRAPAGSAAGGAQKGVLKPERIVLRGMTKADLEAAPEFKRRGEPANR